MKGSKNMKKNLLIMATEYKAMKARADALKADMDALKADMITALGGAEKVVCGQYTVSNQTIISHVVDTKRLQAERPDVANEYTVEKETTRFTVR